jgi:hypothetical protein
MLHTYMLTTTFSGCDADCNNPGCGFDGGDCCEETCTSSDYYSCGDAGFDCIDPVASPGLRNTVRRTLLNLEDSATRDPENAFKVLKELKMRRKASSPSTSDVPSSSTDNKTPKERVKRSLASGECSADESTASPAEDVYGWATGIAPEWKVRGFETCWEANLDRHGNKYDSYSECCLPKQIPAREATPWPRNTVKSVFFCF